MCVYVCVCMNANTISTIGVMNIVCMLLHAINNGACYVCVCIVKGSHCYMDCCNGIVRLVSELHSPADPAEVRCRPSDAC